MEPQVIVCGYGCTNSEFTFSTNAFGFVQWFFDGGTEPLIATGNTVTVHFTTMGRHTVTLVVNGLPYIFNEFVGVFEDGAPFVPNILSNDTVICPGGTSNFSSSYAGLNYQWYFTDGTPPDAIPVPLSRTLLPALPTKAAIGYTCKPSRKTAVGPL